MILPKQQGWTQQRAGWEECPKGLVLLEHLFTQGGLNCQGHGMGKVLFQKVPGLWQGILALEVQLPSCWGQLLHSVPSGKKEQLMLSKAATKSPQSQRGVLQNSNEPSTQAIPTTPLALHGGAIPKVAGWAGRGEGETSVVITPMRED